MGLLHFGPGWLPEREERFPPQRCAVSPHVFCSSCLSSPSSSAPATVGCLSPPPPLITRNPPLPPCTIPSSCKPVGHCSLRSEPLLPVFLPRLQWRCWGDGLLGVKFQQEWNRGDAAVSTLLFGAGGAAVSILLFDAPKPLPRGFAISCSVCSLLQDPALSPAEPQLPGILGEERGQL